MTEEKVCADCKWLKGKKTGKGIECMQPDKQAEWDRRKTLWMGEFRMPNARYKPRSGKACKRFEPIE